MRFMEVLRLTICQYLATLALEHKKRRYERVDCARGPYLSGRARVRGACCAARLVASRALAIARAASRSLGPRATRAPLPPLQTVEEYVHQKVCVLFDALWLQRVDLVQLL